MKYANPVSSALGRAAWAAGCLFVAGCGSGRTSNPPAAAAKTIFEHFPVRVGGQVASLQIAVSPSEQERGLMQRPDLGRDEGMLFVCPAPRTQSFWMRNTPEGLDLGYLGRDGVIAEIYPLLPLDERPVRSHSDQMQFALEMPQGWFATHGIHAGARIDMAAVAEALRSRDYDPEKFGIR